MAEPNTSRGDEAAGTRRRATGQSAAAALTEQVAAAKATMFSKHSS